MAAVQNVVDFSDLNIEPSTGTVNPSRIEVYECSGEGSKRIATCDLGREFTLLGSETLSIDFKVGTIS